MKTAKNIEIDYRVAKMNGRDHADHLVIVETEDMIEVSKNDWTGRYTSEWTIYVNKAARRQVARLYIPRTGEDRAISVADADEIIVLGRDAGRYI
jgi:hypothetical protein